jgi:hypothetical protein
VSVRTQYVESPAETRNSVDGGGVVGPHAHTTSKVTAASAALGGTGRRWFVPR